MSDEERPCPRCHVGRIGNRRARCRECNSFAQQVLRRTAAAMREADPELYAGLRVEVEGQVYAERYPQRDRSTV